MLTYVIPAILTYAKHRISKKLSNWIANNPTNPSNTGTHTTTANAATALINLFQLYPIIITLDLSLVVVASREKLEEGEREKWEILEKQLVTI